MIVIASDHAGIDLNARILEVVRGEGHEAHDLGPTHSNSVDYPDFGHKVVMAVIAGEAQTGILICGTGIGMSMTANRHPGVRAASCHDAFTAEMARRHNDANVLCIGARSTGPGVAEQMARIFLETPFEGGRHQRRVDLIEIEREDS